MNKNIQIKKLYYSPVKSFNFIEDDRLNILEGRGVENDRIFAFVRNKNQDEKTLPSSKTSTLSPLWADGMRRKP